MRCPGRSKGRCWSSSMCRAPSSRRVSSPACRNCSPPPTPCSSRSPSRRSTMARPTRPQSSPTCSAPAFAHRRRPRTGLALTLGPRPGRPPFRAALVVGSLDVLVVGPVPPPVDGRAVATSWLIDALRGDGHAVTVLDTHAGATTKAAELPGRRAGAAAPGPPRPRRRGRLGRVSPGSRGGPAARRPIPARADDADPPLGALRARAVVVAAAGAARPAGGGYATLCSTRRWARSCRRATASRPIGSTWSTTPACCRCPGPRPRCHSAGRSAPVEPLGGEGAGGGARRRRRARASPSDSSAGPAKNNGV